MQAISQVSESQLLQVSEPDSVLEHKRIIIGVQRYSRTAFPLARVEAPQSRPQLLHYCRWTRVHDVCELMRVVLQVKELSNGELVEAVGCSRVQLRR